MQTYTHFLWALVLSQWIIHRQQKISKSNNDNNNHTTTTTTTKWMVAPPSFHQIGVLIGSVLPDMALILTAIVCMVHDHIIYHTTSINTADYVNFNDNDNDENSSDSSSSSVVVYSNTTWTHQLFSDWYFNSPWVKAIHNIFHSPISLGILILITYLIFVYTTTSSTSRSGGGGGGGRGGEDVDGDGKKKELPRRSRKNNNNNNNRSSCCCCNDSNCNMNSSSSFFFWVFISAMFHSLCDIPVHHDDGPLILWPFNWYYRYESPISYYDPNYYGHQFTIVEHTIDFIIIIYECYRCCCCFISSRRQRQRQQQQQQQRDSQHLLEVGGGTESDNGDGNDGDDNDKGRTEFTTLL